MKILLALAILLSSLPISASARNILTATSSNIPIAFSRSTSLPMPQGTPAPEASPTPDPVLEQAERDSKLAEELKKKAVSDKERVEAENAKLKAKVQPLGEASNITIPTGSVTTDSAGWVESQMLAEEAARQITGKLRSALCGPVKHNSLGPVNPQTLIIYSNNDITAVELYGAVIGQLGVLQTDLDTMNALAMKAIEASEPKTGNGDFALTIHGGHLAIANLTPVLAAPGIATGVIKSVAELINLFRTDTTFTNKAVTVSEDLVVSYLVQDIQDTGGTCSAVKTYYPALYPPRLLDDTTESTLLQALNTVEQAKNQAAIQIEALDDRAKELTKLVGMFDDLKKGSKELPEKRAEYNENCQHKQTVPCKKLKAQIEELESSIKTTTKALMEALDKKTVAEIEARIVEIKPWIGQVSDLKKKMQALVTATDLILTKLNAPDEASKLSALAQLLRAERLHGIMDNANAYTLRVAVTANGTTKIKKNLFVDAKVRHSAGADLTYQLFDNEGAIARANGLHCYIEYQSSNAVQRIVKGEKKGVTCESNNGSNNPQVTGTTGGSH